MARRRTRSMRTLCVALTGIATIATSALSGQRMSEAVARGHRAVEDELRREPPPEDLDGRGAHGDNVVLLWNATLLDAVRAVRFAPMLTARAVAVMHTCMCAYAALVDLFPSQQPSIEQAMRELGLDPTDRSIDPRRASVNGFLQVIDESLSHFSLASTPHRTPEPIPIASFAGP